MFLFRNPTQRQLSIALTVLRVVIGAVFIAHGSQKIFTFGLAGIAGGFGQMGIPFAGFMGPFIALLEFFGGIALVAGFLTRLVSLGLAFDMLGAIGFVHLAGGFFLPKGYEFALTLLAASLALVFSGAGSFSVDALFNKRDDALAGRRNRQVEDSRRAA